MPSMPSPNTLHTMMDYPLTLTALLERAGGTAASVEIVSRLPNRGLHRTTWGQFRQRALRLAECLQSHRA